MASPPLIENFDPRYEILSTLGRGGMGVVYRALDRVENQVVALKTLHGPASPGVAGAEPAVPGGEDLHRFSREIRALSLLHHEGIVRLHDVGQWEGRAYFTMELLEGLPLQAFLERPLAGGAELRWLLRVALRVLSALDHLHTAGFVHRDLKPSNIMVQASGRPPRSAADTTALLGDPDPGIKLLDFGLVKPRETPLGAGRPAPGTPLYMAPEQMEGAGPVDPRSDLYSLGVILYQLAAGRLPHLTVASVLSARPPAAPASLNPACPAALSSAILRLLTPEPHRRFTSALEASRSLLSILEERPAPAEEPPPRLLAPGFSGRVEAMELLRESLRAAAAGTGRTVLLSGGRGAGKSWLLDRSGLKAQAVLEHGLSYFQGRYVSGGPLHQGMREVVLGMVLDLLRDPGIEPLPELLGPWGGALLDALGIDAVPALRSRFPPADGGPPAELETERLLQAGMAVFRAAARRPRLVLIDDLHLGDDLDVEILARVSRAIAGLPLLLLVSYRPERFEGSPVLERWLGESGSRPEDSSLLSLHLGSFTDGEAAQMARSMLSPQAEVDPALVGELLDRTGGIPRALECELTSLWAAGALRLEEGVWGLRPEAILGAEARGAEPDPLLEPGERELLMAASVLGEHFEPELLLRLLGDGGSAPSGGGGAVVNSRVREESLLMKRLQRMVARGLLLMTAGGLSIARSGLREWARGLLDEDSRRQIHRRAAQALLALRGEASADQWDAVARHYSGGGDPGKALDFHLRAARRAARFYANRRGIAAYRSALALAEGAARGPIAAELGRLHARIGEYPAALQCFRTAEEAGHPSLPSLLDEVGRVHQRRGELEPARRCFERCLALAEKEPELLAKARYRLGGVHFEEGDLASAARHFEESLELSRARGDLEGMGAAHSGLGLVEKRREALEAAALHFREAIDCAERAGNPAQAATALNNLGNICRARGEDHQAIDCFRRSIELRERVGDRPGLGICLNNLGRALVHRGELKPSVEAAARALRIFEEVGDQKGVLIASGNLGAFRLLQGDFPAARESFLRAASLAERLGDRRAKADVSLCLARLERSREEPALADRHLREGLRALGEEVDQDLRASLLGELAAARLALGDAEGAADALREGLWVSSAAGPAGSRGPLLLVAAEVELARGEPSEAVRLAEEGLAALETAGSRFDCASAHRQLGRAYREKGPDWVDRAEGHLSAALKLFEEMGSEFESGKTLAELGELWLALGETAEAERCYRRAGAALAAADAPRKRAQIEERVAQASGGKP